MDAPQHGEHGPPLKRARPADESVGREPVRVIEDKAIWMDDGNIVVSAGNNPVYLFKCHRSVLSTNSEVLNDMFGLQLSGDKHDGLPIVPLPDPVDDVRALLKILYDPMLSFELRAIDTAARIAGPLRLAKKYEMPKLYTRLVAVLEQDWPKEYSAWERVQEVVKERMTRGMYGLTVPNKEFDVNDFYADPVPVICLAQELDLTNVLPAAWYELQKWWPADTELEFMALHCLSIRHAELTREDLQRFVLGKHKMDTCVKKAYASLRHIVSEDCASYPREQEYGPFGEPPEEEEEEEESAHCRECLVHWFDEQVVQSVLSVRSVVLWQPYDVFAELKKMRSNLGEGGPNDLTSLEDVCDPCRARLSRAIESEQRALWDRISKAFL